MSGQRLARQLVRGGGAHVVAAHRHCIGGPWGWGISAKTAWRSIALVFSSTTFSGMRSANHKNVRGGGPKPRVLQRPFYVLTPGSRPTPALLPLTLVLDEAMSCQQLQRVHLKEHSVEEKVVGGGPAGRVPGQAGEDEFLGGREERQVGGKPSL